jgi:opacity protein-like surface antigen
MNFFIKKLAIIFLSTKLLSAYTDGIDDIYTFIGVQTAYTQYDNVDAPTIGFTYGKQNSKWRTAINYNYAFSSDHTYHSAIIQVDKGVLTEVFRDYPFKPYLGFSLGAMQHRKDGEIDNGYLFGGNAGFNYVLNHVIDIDLGYRYMSTSKFKNLNNRGDFIFSLHYYFE